MAKKNYINLQIHGTEEMKKIFGDSTDRLAEAVKKQLEIEGRELKEATASKLERHQRNKRAWLLNAALTTKVSYSKTTKKVSLRIGGSARVKSDPKYKFNPSNYMFKIEYGARGIRKSTVDKSGSGGRYKKKGKWHDIKTYAYRAPRRFLIPAIESMRQGQIKAIEDAINREIEEINNDLDKQSPPGN